MKLNLITIGKRPPAWISTGFAEYAKRLPKNFQLNLIELAPIKHRSTDPQRLIAAEGAKLLAAVPKDTYLIVLDEHGQELTTKELAAKLGALQADQQDLSLLIGGADGLADCCCQKARWIWSLSQLTLPHQLVKLFVAEQLYRAWTIITKHPYHRD